MAQWMQAAEAPGSAATMRRARPSSCHLKAKHRAATATQRLAATPSARRPAAQLLMQRRTPLFSVWIRGRRPPELARDILTERKPRGKARYGHRSDLTTRKSAFPLKSSTYREQGTGAHWPCQIRPSYLHESSVPSCTIDRRTGTTLANETLHTQFIFFARRQNANLVNNFALRILERTQGAVHLSAPSSLFRAFSFVPFVCDE